MELKSLRETVNVKFNFTFIFKVNEIIKKY
jgi:hypothetical protein